MSMAMNPTTSALTRLRVHARLVGEQAKTACNRAARILRIAAKRAIKHLRVYAQVAGGQAKRAFNQALRLFNIAVWRADKRLSMALGSNPSLLTRLRIYVRPVSKSVGTALNRTARRLRITTKRADRRLNKDWPKLIAGLKRFDGRPEIQGLLLGAFAMGSAFFLATANIGTREAIAERAAEDLIYSLSQVVPAARHDNNLADDTAQLQDAREGHLSFHRARMNEKVAAVAFEMISQGYAGSIKVLLGIDSDGKLLGVRVLAHAETPGLGDKIEVQKADWILGFDGLSLDNPPIDKWKVKKDGGQFDQFSGATVTPRAVVDAIRRGLELFQRNRDQLLDIAGTSEAAGTPQKKS